MEDLLKICLVSSTSNVDDDDWDLREKFLALESLIKEKESEIQQEVLLEDESKEIP